MTRYADTPPSVPTDAVTPTPSSLGHNDPLLQELWAAKASLNAAAEFNVQKRAEQARAFDLEAALAHLRQQVAH